MNKNRIPWQQLREKTLYFLFISIFLFLTTVPVYAGGVDMYTQQKTFTVKLENKTVKDVINYIEKNSEFVFMYSKNSLDILNKQISLQVDNENISAILDRLADETGLKFRIKDRQVIISDPETRSSATQQQGKIAVSGCVYDENDEPIPGVNVYEKGTTNGTVTDMDGLFNLKVPENAVLVASFVGYQQKEVPVKKKKHLEINLIPDNKMLDEVVVVGFGTQKKESVVGAVNTIKAEDLRVPSSNISNALGGRLAGVIAVQRSGEPGADASSFWIRGISTFSDATSPLIFIDNIEASSSDLNALPPEAIEGFSILKDAAATALYGARGANGVMLVTTRTGKNMEKAKVNFRLTQTFAAPTRTVKIADGIDYMNMYNEATMARNPETDPSTLRFSQERIQATKDGLNPYIYPNVDWMDYLFKKMTMNQSANLNVTGGTKRMDYFLSASINNDNGMLKNDPNNNFNNNIRNLRYSFQANLNVMVTPTTKVGVKLNSQILNYSGSAVSTSDIYNKIYQSPGVYFSPTLPALNGEDHILFGNATGGPINLGGGRYENPYAAMVSGYDNRNESTVTTSFHIEQKMDFITKGLSARALVSFKNWTKTDVVRSFDPYYYKITDYAQQPDGSFTYQYEPMNTGRTSLTTTNSQEGNRYINLQFILDYHRRFDKHDVSGMLVYMQRDYSLNTPANFYDTLPERNQGIAGRLTYAFDDRYLAEFNFGYNGSENFKEGDRFGFFPSIALGYIISNERYFQPLANVITNLKLRGSYGLVGNSVSDSRFPYLTHVDLNGLGYQFGNLWQTSGSGAVVTQYGADKAHWEVGKKLNAGIDLGVLNKFNLSVDYFTETRNDIFVTRGTIPSEIGLVAGAKPIANLGKVRNGGVDLTLDYNQAINKDLIISAKGTFTYAKNKLLEKDEPVVDYPYLSDIGQPLKRYRGLVAIGLFEDEEDIANSPIQTYTAKVMPGDIKYADLNNDGKIDDLDKTQFGYPTVPQIVYGFGGSIQYKNWDASIFFQGVAQTSIQLSGIHPFGGDANTVLQFVADDYWSESNPNPNAAYPRLDLSVNKNNSQVSTFWSRNGAFLRLKNIEIGYTFKFIRFYLAGQNLLTFSKFKHWDPELGAGKGLTYPTMLSGTIGAQINF